MPPRPGLRRDDPDLRRGTTAPQRADPAAGPAGPGPAGAAGLRRRAQPAQLRALACDARVVPIVLGGAGQPLDVGRARRTVPAHLRRAVVARDRGCAWPGCDRTPSWCEVHHITMPLSYPIRFLTAA
ncbi:MAG: HNH endonuclease signature motif containing protein [Pseudonocardiaceae bacterium]